MKLMQNLRNSFETKSHGWLRAMPKEKKKYRPISQRKSSKRKRQLRNDVIKNCNLPFSSSKRDRMEGKYNMQNYKTYIQSIPLEVGADHQLQHLKGAYESSTLVTLLLTEQIYGSHQIIQRHCVIQR